MIVPGLFRIRKDFPLGPARTLFPNFITADMVKNFKTSIPAGRNVSFNASECFGVCITILKEAMRSSYGLCRFEGCRWHFLGTSLNILSQEGQHYNMEFL